jgi:uncharacterized membrane protein YfcA
MMTITARRVILPRAIPGEDRMALLAAGLLTGIIGGLFGVGGGEIFIPLLIYLFGFSQHQAQGGALIATRLHGDILRRIFGAFLFLVSLHMMLGRHGR